MQRRVGAGLRIRQQCARRPHPLDSPFRDRQLYFHSAQRLSDIVGEKREEIRLPQGRDAIMASPHIRVEGLTFAYGPTEPPIFSAAAWGALDGVYYTD